MLWKRFCYRIIKIVIIIILMNLTNGYAVFGINEGMSYSLSKSKIENPCDWGTLCAVWGLRVETHLPN
jgi:hypothetical protein